MPTTNYHTTPYGANLIFNEVVSLHPRALFATPDCISKPADLFAQRYTKPLQLGLKALAPLWVVRWESNPHRPRPQRGALPLSYSQHIAIDFYIGYRSSLWPLTGGTISGFPIQPYPTPLMCQSAYGLRSKVATILSRLGFAPFAASIMPRRAGASAGT